jgi:hypothetical protein
MKGFSMTYESKGTITRFDQTLPRRVFFKCVAFLSLLSFSTMPLYAKGTQEQFKYQSKPNNGQSCQGCMHFEAEKKECKVVDGTISAEGWCTLYHAVQK